MSIDISAMADILAIISFIVSTVALSASVTKKFKMFIVSIVLECLFVVLAEIKKTDYSENKET